MKADPILGLYQRGKSQKFAALYSTTHFDDRAEVLASAKKHYEEHKEEVDCGHGAGVQGGTEGGDHAGRKYRGKVSQAK
ncbi:unnamed protein product [Mortierella alpina]